MENVVPKAIQIEKGMTYEESRVFMEIDRLLSRVVAEGAKQAVPLSLEEAETAVPTTPTSTLKETETRAPIPPDAFQPVEAPTTPPLKVVEKSQAEAAAEPAPPALQPTTTVGYGAPTVSTVEVLKPRAPKPRPLRREVTLSRLGFEVTPYSDESDDHEYFVEGKTIYVNRSHPVYKKEIKKGRDILRRHVLRIVASALATVNYPKPEALEYANRLIAEALKHF